MIGFAGTFFRFALALPLLAALAWRERAPWRTAGGAALPAGGTLILAGLLVATNRQPDRDARPAAPTTS